MTITRTTALILTTVSLSLGLGACSSMGKKSAPATAAKSGDLLATKPEAAPKSGLFGLGGQAAKSKATTEAGIGVNAYLWRATLDTVSFMPLTSADPWGGVIITDWYADPKKPDERFKASVFILDTRLRADALNVNINKQVLLNGNWVEAETSAQTSIDFENAILTRARQLRLSEVKK